MNVGQRANSRTTVNCQNKSEKNRYQETNPSQNQDNVTSKYEAYAIVGGIVIEGIAITTEVFLGASLGVLSIIMKGDTEIDKSKARPYPLTQEEIKASVIYRWGSKTNSNLTPRESDKDGLSFSLFKPTDREKYVQTTIGEVLATGQLKAVIDKPGHVAVTPVEWPINKQRYHEWQATRKNANTNPHHLTLILQSITR